MGEVNAVVYVVGSESLPSGSKTRMEVSSKMGSTKLVLVSRSTEFIAVIVI
jgi:hypothetical protein